MSVEEYHKCCCSAFTLLEGQFTLGTLELWVQLTNHSWRTAYSILKFYFDLTFCVGVTIISLVALHFHYFSCHTSDIGPANWIPPKQKLFDPSWPSRHLVSYIQIVFCTQKMHKPVQWMHCAALPLSPSVLRQIFRLEDKLPLLTFG